VVTDTGTARVAVSTVSGGELPDTGTPWYSLLMAGLALVLVGAFGLWRTTRKIHG
jgi:LPXTG-motif cell wall-anchored protein